MSARALSPRAALSLLLVPACLALGATAAPAGAATVSETFPVTGGAQPFTVPGGVEVLDVVAIGGRGGDGDRGTGGRGARVTGTIAVTPGQRLWVLVGANGRNRGCPPDGNPSSTEGVFGGGGAGGGLNQGCSQHAASGGGASDVRACEPGGACDLPGDPLGRLLVAGGGGGAGRLPDMATGAGGDAGADGESIDTAGRLAGGGGAGTTSGGGAGGVSNTILGPPIQATGGSLHTGGIGATGGMAWAHGGGGGGGLYGGGGGGTNDQRSGGGGGGSSLVPAGGAMTLDASGTPIVVLRWEVGAPESVERPELAAATRFADGTQTTTVTTVVRDADGAPVPGADVTFSATGPQPTFGPTDDHGDGSYSATVTAATSRGATEIVARLGTPSRTSAPVTLTHVDRPVVTTPVDGTPALDALSGARARMTISGTADLATTAVDVGCMTPIDGFRAVSPGTGVPVSGGTWTIADAELPTGTPCRLVAFPAGMAPDERWDVPGPRLRRLRARTSGGPDAVRSISGTMGGLDGAASVRTFGAGCPLSLYAVPDDFVNPSWVSCGADVRWADAFDGAAGLIVDGRTAVTAGFVSAEWGTLGGAAPLAVETTVAHDGALVVEERSAVRRCADTDDPAPEPEACGTLVDTGVVAVVRTRLLPSGTRVQRSFEFESADGAPHGVALALTTEASYDDRRLDAGDGSWVAPAPGSAVPVTADRSTVLTHDAAHPSRPGLSITAVPAPAAQVALADGLGHRFEIAVPAGQAAGVSLDLASAPVDDLPELRLRQRASYDLALVAGGPATTDAATAEVSGTVSASVPAGLRVAGEPVVAGPDGRWTATVALVDGENRIEVEARSRFEPIVETTWVTIERRAPDPEPTPTPGGSGGGGAGGGGGADDQRPTPPTGPTPPASGPPAPTPVPATPVVREPRLVGRIAVPERISLDALRAGGLRVVLRLLSRRSAVTAELTAPWGVVAELDRPRAGGGRTALALEPGRRAAARAARALARRGATKLRLTIVVRRPSGQTQTIERTIRLVR